MARAVRRDGSSPTKRYWFHSAEGGGKDVFVHISASSALG